MKMKKLWKNIIDKKKVNINLSRKKLNLTRGTKKKHNEIKKQRKKKKKK